MLPDVDSRIMGVNWSFEFMGILKGTYWSVSVSLDDGMHSDGYLSHGHFFYEIGGGSLVIQGVDYCGFILQNGNKIEDPC